LRPLRCRFNFFSVHNDGILGGFNCVQILADLADVAALSGVVLEQVSQHSGAGQIIDGNYFVAFGAEHLSESQTSDTAKAINRNFNGHSKFLQFVLFLIVIRDFAYFCKRFLRFFENFMVSV